MGTPAVNILPNYQKLGLVGTKLLPFAHRYIKKLDKELSFTALFQNAVIDLYWDNKKFTVQIFNPQSFGAVNNYNHAVGDIIRDKMVETMVKFYQENGINARVFVIQGINRAILLEGIDPMEAARYAAELKKILETREYRFEIAPKDIEHPATKKAFKEYIAKKRGIPESQVDEGIKYVVDIKDAPKVKSDGSTVEAFKISVGEFHYDPSKPGTRKYSPIDIENAAIALLNKLNQDSPTEVKEASLDVILRDIKLVDFKWVELGPEVLAAIEEFANLKELQERVLEAPERLYEELGAYYKKLIPKGLQDQVKAIEIHRGSGTKTSPYIASSGEIVVPLIDVFGRPVAEVRIYGKNSNSFTFLSSRLGELFSIQKRTLGGMAFKWNADLYLDPKSSLYNGRAYYEELARLHATKTKYILVRGDINYFGSWVGLNKDYSILGTELGDAIFKDFSDRALKFFKNNGISVKIARLGGDELALIFTGEKLSREAVATKLQEFGREMKSAKLIYPVNEELLSEKGRESLRKYVQEFKIKPNSDGTYSVDLYEFERYAKKYGKFVKGMGVSFGVHDEVDPVKVEAAIREKNPGLSEADLGKMVRKFIHQMDAEADVIAGRAKNGDKNGLIKIAFDRRDGVRVIVDETDSLVESPKAVPKKSEALPAEISEALKVIKKALSDPATAPKIVEYLKTAEGRALLETAGGKKFLQELQAKVQVKGTTEALKIEGGGLLVGLATLIGVKKLADLLGIEDKLAHFVFVLGVSHIANLGAQERLLSLVKGKEAAEAAKILKTLENPTLFKSVVTQFKGLLGGLAGMAFVSVVTKGIMDYLGTNPALAEKVNFGTSFVGLAAAHFTTGRIAAKLGETALQKAGLKFLGRFAGGVGLANLLTDGVFQLFSSNYRLYVNRRAYDEIQTKRVASGTVGKIGAFVVEFFHTLGGAASEAAAAADFPEITRKIVEQDIEDAQSLREGLRRELKEFLENGGDLSVLLQKAEFGFISVPTGKIEKSYWKGECFETEVYEHISEEEVFKYMTEYVKTHPQVELGSEEYLAAVIKHFGGKITAKDCQRVLEKGILISWQSRIAQLHFIQPSIFKGFESETLNDDIRSSCASNGVIKDLPAFKRDFLGI